MNGWIENVHSAHGPAAPLADPDSRVLPNKNGGFAPNYTAVLAVDSQRNDRGYAGAGE